ncbi:MAG: hypothetical protein ABII90_15610 [Bacteroidota bacterium]
MKKRHIIILIVSIGLVGLIVIRLITGMDGEKKHNGNQESSARYVKVMEIENDTITLIVKGYGRVSSSRNVNLSSEVQGKLLCKFFA